MKTILTEKELDITIQRLSHQLLENHLGFHDLAVIGIQPRGIFFSDRIVQQINQQIKPGKITYGKLDITVYRDDVRQGLHTLNHTDISFSIENKTVILVDDVLYTGRTIRAAMVSLTVSFATWEKSVDDQQHLLAGKSFKSIPIQPVNLAFVQEMK